ncbi:MAG: BREX-1 system adenine-specific DNA-methyltransferase PglX, partial [Anaerolineae bacterium]|nr:BREX-1 system adenine-specific DNA-methyltransferase PglX [Anaerolineae bacterium]
MHPDLKKTLKSLSLDLRHLLEGQYDTAGTWRAGDLEQRLNALGVWRDRAPLPADELSHLDAADRQARAVVDAYLALRRAADIDQADAVGELVLSGVEAFVRETAYTWANRLLALRCMEARGLIDEVILQKAVYGGRSLEHHRLAQRQPELCMGEDDGLFAALDAAFVRQAAHLPLLFDPRAPGVALRPSVAALKQAVTLLSSAPSEVFQAPDALGWAYQYWNTEEKDRVFEKVRTERGAKIAGADIIPATQLYTEPYMVKFLVQNSLGALWMGMYPESRLYESWEYYVRDADRAPVTKKRLREVTFLDPACGSGHFLLEAFDLFYAMYEEEGALITPEAICAAILEDNLYGIDIDERAVQIAEAALWMKAAEKAFDFRGTPANLVATNIRLPRGKDHLAAFLAQHPEDHDLRPALEVIFEGLEHADELGSLLQLEEPVEKELRYLQAKMAERAGKPEQLALLAQVERPKQGELPVGVESYEEWKTRTLARLKTHFAAEAQAANLAQAFFGRSAEKGVRLFDMLARRYDVVAANPPYMGSGNMGVALKKYTERHYPEGKRDLYTAFILRCADLSRECGYVGMVTRQSWMFLRYFKDIRLKTEGATTRGLLIDVTFDLIVQLGAGAFEEISGEVVSVVMFTFTHVPPHTDHHIYANRLLAFQDPESKASALRAVAKGSPSITTYNPRQLRFFHLPESPFLFWLTEGLWELFEEAERLQEHALPAEGIQTGDNARWVRYFWEIPNSAVGNEWVYLLKGGGYQKWLGLDNSVVRWNGNGDLLQSFPGATLRNSHCYFQKGLSYTDFASGCLGVRFMSGDEVFDLGAPSIFTLASSNWTLVDLSCVLNSRVASYLVRLLSPNPQHIRTGYLKLLPLPRSKPRTIVSDVVAVSVSMRESLESHSNILSRRFFPFNQSVDLSQRFLFELGLSLGDGKCEELAFEAYRLAERDNDIIFGELGKPVVWYPSVKDYEDFPDTLKPLIKDLIDGDQLSQRISRLEKGVDDSNIKSLLHTLFEAGPGTKPDVVVDDLTYHDTQDSENDNYSNPVPPETFLEELSQKLQIHPISVYWLLKEGIEQEGWRCLPEERRVAADRFTVLILRLLGHRWPKQIEAGEPVPEWAAPDGIILLTEGVPASAGLARPTMLDLVHERLTVEFPGGEAAALEREFQELMGESLEAWLGQTFFKHHTRQFKKRPIAWQLQSGRWTTRQQPAFACLVYYHKLDGNTLTTLQSQYVRPLRQRYETELRGIEGVPAAARSARQDARRVA